MKSIEELNLENFDFSQKRNWQRRISKYIEKGWKISVLCVHLKITESLFYEIMKEDFRIEVMNYKEEAYSTEEEMINGFECKFEDLSEKEKELWLMDLKTTQKS